MSMSSPADKRSFYDSRDHAEIPEILPDYLYSGVQSTPGRVFRDAIAYGVSPQECGPAIYDDEGAESIDALSDPRVSATDLMNPDFYADGEYTRPDSLKAFFDNPAVSPASSDPPAASTATSVSNDPPTVD